MITNYAANKFLGVLVGNVSSMTFASDIYVGLSTTEPNADGTGATEPEGNGYARTRLGNVSQVLAQKMATPANGSSSNDEVIYFPEATGNWGTITHFCIYDAPANGNLLAYGTLTTPITPTAGTIPIVRVGELTVTLS